MVPNKINFNRTLQIFNKTNQFNFTLNRYSDTKLKEILKNKKYKIVLFDLKDKFGNHGIISGYIQKKEKDRITIIDFAMSCRVISRLVEDYMIYYIDNKNKNLNKFINYKKSNLNKDLIPKFLQKNYFTFEKKLNGNNVYKIKNNKELNDIKEIF